MDREEPRSEESCACGHAAWIRGNSTSTACSRRWKRSSVTNCAGPQKVPAAVRLRLIRRRERPSGRVNQERRDRSGSACESRRKRPPDQRRGAARPARQSIRRRRLRCRSIPRAGRLRRFLVCYRTGMTSARSLGERTRATVSPRDGMPPRRLDKTFRQPRDF